MKNLEPEAQLTIMLLWFYNQLFWGINSTVTTLKSPLFLKKISRWKLKIAVSMTWNAVSCHHFTSFYFCILDTPTLLRPFPSPQLLPALAIVEAHWQAAPLSGSIPKYLSLMDLSFLWIPTLIVHWTLHPLPWFPIYFCIYLIISKARFVLCNNFKLRRQYIRNQCYQKFRRERKEKYSKSCHPNTNSVHTNLGYFFLNFFLCLFFSLI